MTTLREAAEASLDALKMMRQKYGEYACQACDHADVAIIKLCAALAEPVQKPVAWACKRALARIKDFDSTIYANGGFDDAVPLYTAPPQRKPLTDEEIYEMYNEPRSDADMVAFARAIERAHGIGSKS